MLRSTAVVAAITLFAAVPLVATILKGLEPIPPEQAERHYRAHFEGDWSGRPAPPAPPPLPDPLSLPDPEEPPAPPPPPLTELEAIAVYEYKQAGVPAYLIPWLLAQIKVESRWNCDAVSRVGARGCPQAMPRTWAEEAPRTDPSCEGVEPNDPHCGFRFQASYMDRVAQWVDDQGERHLAAAGYNAGAGHIQKEKRACERALGCDPDTWFGNVEEHCQRPAWACRETIAYLNRILESLDEYEALEDLWARETSTAYRLLRSRVSTPESR